MLAQTEGQTQQGSTPRCEAKCETRLLLEEKHVVNESYVIHPE